MAYVTQSELIGMAPQDYLDTAQDDDGDGNVAPVWTSVAESVDQEINGRLAARYTTPISPVPDVVKAAAKALACWFIWNRRGATDEQNPWHSLAKYWQTKLDRIARGEEPLSVDQAPAEDPVVAITDDARTHSAGGNLMA